MKPKIKVRKLNQVGLLSFMVKANLSSLREYLVELENFMLEAKKSTESKFAEIEHLKGENEDYYYALEDSFAVEYQNYNEYYPNKFRSALLLETYSIMECGVPHA